MPSRILARFLAPSNIPHLLAEIPDYVTGRYTIENVINDTSQKPLLKWADCSNSPWCWRDPYCQIALVLLLWLITERSFAWSFKGISKIYFVCLKLNAPLQWCPSYSDVLQIKQIDLSSRVESKILSNMVLIKATGKGIWWWLYFSRICQRNKKYLFHHNTKIY